MSVRYEIEPLDLSGLPHDRANVSILDTSIGKSFAVTPNGGQPYNAGTWPGPCNVNYEAGWAASSPGAPAFVSSTWSYGQLNPFQSAFPGKLLRLEVTYSTDAADARPAPGTYGSGN